jgi:hypothetical protein
MKIKDLSKEQFEELIEKNKWLREQIEERANEDMYFIQSEQFELVGASAFDYHDHYNSFYLTCPMSHGVKDGSSLRGKLDKDYMSEDQAKIYDKICKNADRMDEIEYQCEEYDKLDEECDDLADELAESLTRDLEAIICTENYEMLKQDLIDRIMDGEEWLSDLEVEGSFIKELVYHK